MADNSSLDLCPDGSPAESVNEEQQFDPCTTTTDVPINATSTSVCLGDPDPHHRNLSTLRLLFAHIGAALTLFLATTDATIVSTSLPTIVSDLQGSQVQYTWVGAAYMLTQTAFQPLYGRVSDLVGRKNVLYFSMAIFALGSALCGAAQSIEWLIAARALAGIGAGGIVSAVWVITAEIVEVRQRAMWSQALSVTWCCSAIAGPLLGGVFSNNGQQHTGTVSWRWGFFVNLPICFVSWVVIATSLRGVQLKQASDVSWLTLAQNFDFIGLALFMGGTICIIIGFSFATEFGWASPLILSLLIIGVLLLLYAGYHEKNTSRECLFPPTTFNNISTVVTLIITFLHNFAFSAGTFYLALFFQAATGASPLESGIKSLPYSLGSSLASMPVAWFIGYWQQRTHDTSGQNWMISIGLFICMLGFGLLTLLNENANVVAQVVFPLIAGIGIGMLFHAPYQVFVRSLRPWELATGTSAFFLVRFTGATVGLAVAGTIFYDGLSKLLPADFVVRGHALPINYSDIKNFQPDVKAEVLHAVSSSIKMIWMLCTPCLGVAFLMSWLLRKMPSSDSAETIKTHTIPTQSAEKETV